MEITFQSGPPSPEQYFALYETTGWNKDYQVTAEQLLQAVKNSQFVVAAWEGERLVGFGRVLTDGVMHAMIYEMIIHPDYQGRGIGTQIIRKLIAWCDEHKIHDVQLFCARGKRGFYEKNGFVARPEEGPGMQLRRDS